MHLYTVSQLMVVGSSCLLAVVFVDAAVGFAVMCITLAYAV
jgi:hypothetical protein